MQYNILEIEAKRQEALTFFHNATGTEFLDKPIVSWIYEIAQILRNPPDCFRSRVNDARFMQDQLAHPQDAMEPPTEWMSEEYRPKRFVLKACGLWSDEYQEPMVSDPRTWQSVNDTADRIKKYLENPKYRDVLIPDLFTRYYNETSNSTLRPAYISERWNDFLRWCREKGHIS